MSASRRLVRTLVPFAVSAAVIALIAMTVDFRALLALDERFDRTRLPEVGLLLLVIFGAFSLRWRRLLAGRASWRVTLSSTALGLGGNQVLPARGGDLVRVLTVARGAGISIHLGLSRLVLEKLLDLLATASMAALALVFLLEPRADAAGHRTGLVTALVVLGIVVAAAVAVRTGALERVLAATARLLRIGPVLYRHAYRPLFHLRAAARARLMVVPLALTMLLWVALYTRLFQVVGAAVGVPVDFGDAVVLASASALGLAIPAAPSGLGTFHASVISGSLLLGRSAAEGLVLAVALHATLFVAWGGAGLVALALAGARAAAERSR